MAAYLIVNIDVTDPEKYREYIGAVPRTIAAYGGKYLARGGEVEVLEGNWAPKRVVILEFESVARAKQWWNSEEYRHPKEIRRSASLGDIMLVEGIG